MHVTIEQGCNLLCYMHTGYMHTCTLYVCTLYIHVHVHVSHSSHSNCMGTHKSQDRDKSYKRKNLIYHFSHNINEKLIMFF